MGHATVAIAYTYTPSHRADPPKTGQLQPYIPDDNLTNALGFIRVLGLELLEQQELRPHLHTVLTAMHEGKGAAEQVVASGILPVLALSLRSRGRLTLLTAHLVAELAKDSLACKAFGEAGLGSALLSLLSLLPGPDQDLLLLATRALARMAHDNAAHQELLLRQGAVPRLVSLLLRSPSGGGGAWAGGGTGAVQSACLLALCSLSDMGGGGEEEEELVWEEGPSLRPEERVYRGVTSTRFFFSSWVTVVCVACRGPGLYTCSVEAFQRCSASFWKVHGKRRPGLNARHRRLRLLPGLAAGCSRWYRSLRCPALGSNGVARTRSLRTRVFHTFL